MAVSADVPIYAYRYIIYILMCVYVQISEMGAGAFFALSRLRARREKKSLKARRKKSAKKAKAPSAKEKKREFALFMPPTVEIRF